MVSSVTVLVYRTYNRANFFRFNYLFFFKIEFFNPFWFLLVQGKISGMVRPFIDFEIFVLRSENDALNSQFYPLSFLISSGRFPSIYLFFLEYDLVHG
jgi:hypothetical protein